MATGDPLRLNDPEFSPAPGPPAPLRIPWGSSDADYLRLVVNPFLAVFGLVALLGLARLGARIRQPWLVVLALGSLALVPRLLHYHCLDCGTTARFGRWRAHRCRRVVERGLEGRRPKLRLPSPPLQLGIWAYVAVMAFVFALILGPRGR